MASPRIAKSLAVLRSQVDAMAPARAKDNDGWLGDTRHQATKSEHNPDANGVVRALDITNDPAHGVNSRALAQRLLDSRDPRILYMISNGEIQSSKVSPWVWRPYHGVNDHSHHFHLSVVDDPVLYDSERPWAIGRPTVQLPPSPVRYNNITATVFGGPDDEQPVAYSDVEPGWANRPGVALPYRFSGSRRWVRVWKDGKYVDCQIVDVGPWFPSARGPADPYWQTGGRPRAETGGNTSNQAGIDLTPAAARAIGLNGKGYVSWEFIDKSAVTAPRKPPVTAPVVIGTGAAGGAAALLYNGQFLAAAVLVIAVVIGLVFLFRSRS